MKDLNSRLDGLYNPSFFCMKIDSLSYDENMSDRETSLFVHEYIHYLQNITTICGLERLKSDFAILVNMVNWIKGQQGKKISIPISKNVLSELTIANGRICDLTWGETGDIKKFKFVSAQIIDSIKVDDFRDIESVCITYKGENDSEELCSFGTREIYESMAYLVERHITKDYEISPDYPYNAAQIVIEYIYPELLNDYRNLLVLYDISLMSSNPGVELFKMVQWLKDIRYQPVDPSRLFHFIDCNWEFFDLKQRVKKTDYFIARIEEVRNNLHILLNDVFFNDYHIWVDRILDYVLYLRIEKPLFWLELYEQGYVKYNNCWIEIINNAGSPLIETNKHEYFHVNPLGCDSSCTIYFKVFSQIYRLLVYGDIQCGLIPWCNDKRNSVSVNTTCFNCPWNHQEHNGQLCTFKGIWQHWGLMDCCYEKIDI